MDDVLVIPDTSKYQYRFTDEIILDPSSDPRTLTNATYSEDIALLIILRNSFDSDLSSVRVASNSQIPPTKQYGNRYGDI